MTFVKALEELKLGKVIYNTRYPKICYQYTPHNEMLYRFNRCSSNKNKWYYSEEDDAISFQEVLFDDWEILNTDGLKFIF